MADRSVDAPITSLPVVNTDKETIFVGLDAGLKTGDKVMYYNGGGSSIGGRQKARRTACGGPGGWVDREI